MAVYLRHCRKVLEKSRVLLVHGMQASIQKAVRLALALIADNPDMVQEVVTDTVPTMRDGAVREVPAVHIRLEKRLIF
jgi:hypothetical protein